MRRRVGGVFRSLLVGAVLLNGVGCGSGTGNGGADDRGAGADVADAPDPAGADGGLDAAGESVGDAVTGDAPVDADAGPQPCRIDDDCANADLGEGEPCHRKKVCRTADGTCAFDWEANCCRVDTLLESGFEGGLEGWTVSDSNTKDRVSWSVVGTRKASGGSSLYFGDPQCHTYYNGALDASCNPVDPAQGDATVVRGGATSPAFALPPLDATRTWFTVSFQVFIDSQPIVPGVSTQPDQFRLLVVQDPGGTETTVTVFSSVDVQKTTGGTFVRVVGDLSRWAGQTVALRLFFDSQDESLNRFEGVYVDDVVVSTSCVEPGHPACQPGAACPGDGLECTDDACQSLCNVAGKGVCEYRPVPACTEPECTPATVETDCPVTGECAVASCPAGACVFDTLPPEVCCNRTTLLAAAFDSGLDGFTVRATPDDPDVRWQASTRRSTSGGRSLYYGNAATGTYAGETPTVGEATGAPMELPAQGYSFLSFRLFLSTEFDDWTGDYYNPLGRDRFEVRVVEGAGTADEAATTVWSSDNVKGTTGKQFVKVGVDLSAFAGRTVSLRFRFDPADALMNAFEGAYVDDVVVAHDPCVRRDCEGAADCRVDGVCRTGSCVAEVCATQETGAEGCCRADADCDDGDPCTADGCVGIRCLHAPVDGDGCCAPRDLAIYTFDVRTDLDGFQVEDQSVPGIGAPAAWALSDVLARSPERSMRFGNDAGYDNGGIARGTATSPRISVPSNGSVRLDLALFLAIEPDPARDLFRVEVVADPDTTPVMDKSAVPTDAYGTWRDIEGIDLSAFRGRDIRLRFVFDSVDAVGNDGSGVFVDDVAVRKACP